MAETDIAVPEDRQLERPQGLGIRGWLRWAWRQLVSMRVAIGLLLLLGIGMIPASFLPQYREDPAAVAQWRDERPVLGSILDALGLFDVLNAPWFAAIYILLFISLVGCILPRSLRWWRRFRSTPSRVPRRLERYETHAAATYAASAEETADVIAAHLGKRYRVNRRGLELSAENGYVRELGNLVFHIALLGLLITFAAGQAVSYRGQAIIVEGDTFTNSAAAFDTFEPGALFDTYSLAPFRVRLDEMKPSFHLDGSAEAFEADVTIFDPDAGADSPGRTTRIAPNHPLSVDGTSIYLSGNGYAPHITVRDSAGDVAFSGNVVFLPQDSMYTSTGVLKVPDVTDRENQLGFRGTLFPTAVPIEGGLTSIHPDATDPVLTLTMWVGDLGLDGGVPQNVYVLDTSQMRAITATSDRVSGEVEVPVLIALSPGLSIDLPEGLGTVTFDGLDRFVALDLRNDPTIPWLLLFAVAGLAGITASLLLPHRRLWVRVSAGENGETVAEAAGLSRRQDAGLAQQVRSALDSGRPLTDAEGDQR